MPSSLTRSYLALLGIYLAVRLALIPSDWMGANFGHDSAYIARLAENLIQGKGYVNDALWLVFLRPEGLPMPYHNANPLYPTLIAGVSGTTGLGVISTGFAINAVAHALLLLLLAVASRPWVPSITGRAALAVGVGFFPAIFTDSLTYLPDMLCLLFSVAVLVCLIRTESIWGIVLAGGCFGLAWLARSSAIVVLPLVVVFLLGRHGVWRGLGRCVILGAIALVVVSPWLWHTYTVWGNPLRSDSAYYWLQEYHARAFDNDVERYWHSLGVPPSLGTILSREPFAFLRFYAESLPRLARSVLAGWTDARPWLAGLLAISALVALVRCWALVRHPTQRTLGWPLFLGALATTLFTLLLFVPRAQSLEIRYLSLLSVLFALLLLFGLAQAIRGLETESSWLRNLNGFLVAIGMGYWILWVPYQDVRDWIRLSAPLFDRIEYRELAREFSSKLDPTEAVVVGNSPYFFTLATGRPSLSFPQCGHAELLEYMNQYHAHYVFLIPEEILFWRPRWMEAPPPEFVFRPGLLSGVVFVFERKE